MIQVVQVHLEPAAPNALRQRPPDIRLTFGYELKRRLEIVCIVQIHQTFAEGEASRSLDIVRHHQRAFGTVGPEPDERKRLAAVLSNQKAKDTAHQGVDARVERPSREGDAFPAAEANLLQVPATAHRQRRTKEVVHLPRNRAGGDPRQEVVPVLVITLLPQVADDLSEVERQSQAIGVNPDILEGVVQLSPWFQRRRALRQPAVAHRVAKCEVASVRAQVAIGLQRHERRRKSEVIAERMISGSIDSRHDQTATSRPRPRNDSSAASSSRTTRRPARPSLRGRWFCRMQSRKLDSSSLNASVASTFGDHTSPDR